MPSPVQLIDESLLERTLDSARRSPRLRANHNFHPDLAANPHRFLNAFLRGSYCAPHRHREVPKPESFVVLRGELALWIFDDDGNVSERHVLGRDGVMGIDIAPGCWHTLAALSETAICFEVKPGPYDAKTDKEFAPWAPREGEPGANEYLSRLVAELERTGTG